MSLYSARLALLSGCHALTNALCAAVCFFLPRDAEPDFRTDSAEFATYGWIRKKFSLRLALATANWFGFLAGLFLCTENPPHG